MCGIAGVVDSRGVDRGQIERMNRAQSHRGPDDSGVLCDPTVGFGHRRLSIIDLAQGHQPMTNADGTVWVVFNGEIYNYRELKASLQGICEFGTDSDTEVLLQLYEHRGEACLAELRGMFAFAIYDFRTQTLFAARDHFGQKPFYYWPHDHGLAFSSEPKALLALEPALAELDEQALMEYFTLRIVTPPRSMFRRIRKLPPAHFLRYRRGELEIGSYWDLHYRDKFSDSDESLVDELHRQLDETVRYHLVSDVPVGAFLSGGLDSSMVVASMADVAGGGFPTFAGDVPYKDKSELPYAEAVSRRYGTVNHPLRFVPSLADTLPKVLWHLDEPSDSLSVALYYIAELAAQHVKVVLGGEGGDELFGGYDRYYGYSYAGYLGLLPRALRRHVIGALLERLPDGQWYQSATHQLRWLNWISQFDGAERYSRSLSYFYFNETFQDRLLTPGFRARNGAFDPEYSVKHYFDSASADEVVDRMLHSDAFVRMPDHPVMVLDRMTMAHGLEARAPFLDHRLAEFCARLPVSLKVSGRNRRVIQRRLAGRMLPDEVLHRPKQGFASAITYMLRDEYEHLYGAFLRHSRLGQQDIVDQRFVDTMLDEYLGRRADHGQRLWLLCSAEMWYRMYIDGEGAEGVAMVSTNEAA